MAQNVEGGREQVSREHTNLEKGAGSSKKLGNGAGSKNNYQGARGKISKEQEAKKGEKGAVKISRKERVLKYGWEQGEQVKMSKGAGSLDLPTRASIMTIPLAAPKVALVSEYWDMAAYQVSSLSEDMIKLLHDWLSLG